MACVDVDLCDKIDTLNTSIGTLNTNLLSQTESISAIDTNVIVLQQGTALILGFLAWFLFFIIISFFLKIFNKMF